MNLQLDRPIIFFDLETTGLNINKDRIVQIAAIKYWPTEYEPSCLETLLNPTIPIEKGASDVHGITNERVKDKLTFELLANEIFNFFHGCDFAGYNILNFDVPLLNAELLRCGLRFTHNPLYIDCFQIFKKQLPHTLEGALKYYTGKPHINAHDALADVKATIDVFKGQLSSIKKDTVQEIFDEFRDPRALDIAGKLKLDHEGFTTINFGKHKGKRIKAIPNSYFEWLKNKDVLANDAWDIIREVYSGKRK